MDFERFTGPARRVVVLAQEAARAARQQHIGTHHLLIALAHPIGTNSSLALASLGISEPEVTRRAGRYGKARLRASPAHIPPDPHTRQTLLGALSEADKRGDVHVLTADLLLSLVAGQRGAGGRILAALGVSYESIRSALTAAATHRPDVTDDGDRTALVHTLAADQETASMFRCLHAANPEAFRSDLAQALRRLVTDLDSLSLESDAHQAREDLTALTGSPD